MKKYISFSLGCTDVIDSHQFMSSSLKKLVENHTKEGRDIYTTSYFEEEKISLLLGKTSISIRAFGIVDKNFRMTVTID